MNNFSSVLAKRKIWISILFGILGLVLSPYGINVTLGEISVGIPWSLFFPIIIAMAFGWRLGVLSGLSGGALFPFLLWGSNGWVNLSTTLVYLFFYALMGVAYDKSIAKRLKKIPIRAFIAISLFIIVCYFYYIFLFNPILNLNPPFWVENTINHLSLKVLYGFLLKESVNIIILAIISGTIIRLPIVRKILSLAPRKGSQSNHKIFLIAIVISILVWLCFFGLDALLFEEDNILLNQHSLLLLLIIVASGFSVTSILFYYSETQNKMQHRLKKSEEKFIQSIISDISDRKAAEKELISAKERAEESDRLKSAFLANMSHEIRTPMNGILGFAELLKEPDLTGEQQQEYIRIIEKSGTRMLNIINDIVDISKIESGQMKVSLSETNVNDQIEYLFKFFKTEAESKGIQLFSKCALSVKEAVLLTDREKLYAILTNLIKNAIKYTKSGTIEFGYDFDSVKDKACLVSTDKTIEFYVKDTGIGIPTDRQDAIFERFIQADIADKMARQGAGLGLAISRAYVQMLGGKIWVDSEDGKGSTFYFVLPYQAKPVDILVSK